MHYRGLVTRVQSDKDGHKESDSSGEDDAAEVAVRFFAPECAGRANMRLGEQRAGAGGGGGDGGEFDAHDDPAAADGMDDVGGGDSAGHRYDAVAGAALATLQRGVRCALARRALGAARLAAAAAAAAGAKAVVRRVFRAWVARRRWRAAAAASVASRARASALSRGVCALGENAHAHGAAGQLAAHAATAGARARATRSFRTWQANVQAMLVVKRSLRCTVARRRLARARLATTIIAAFWRAYMQRVIYKALRCAAVRIQAHVRGWFGRVRAAEARRNAFEIRAAAAMPSSLIFARAVAANGEAGAASPPRTDAPGHAPVGPGMPAP